MVIDASVLVPVLADDDDVGAAIRARLLGEELSAPELVDLEVVSALRRLARTDLITVPRAVAALADLAAVGLSRHPHRPLLPRIWELRENVSVYDAAYVALAEALGATLATADGRLAQATGLRCRVELLA